MFQAEIGYQSAFNQLGSQKLFMTVEAPNGWSGHGGGLGWRGLSLHGVGQFQPQWLVQGHSLREVHWRAKNAQIALAGYFL
jgi:hypothetical protein